MCATFLGSSSPPVRRIRPRVVHDDGVLRIVRTPGIRGYALYGEIDASTYHALAGALRDLGAKGDVHLNLHGVTFCDAAGLGAMIGLTGQIGGRHQLILDGLTRTLCTLLTIVGWDTLPNLEVRPRVT